MVFQWPCGTRPISLSPRGPTAAQPHHLGIGGSLVDEDQVGRIKHALFSHPALARSRHVRALLLRRV
jgi:hypothetical protein